MKELPTIQKLSADRVSRIIQESDVHSWMVLVFLLLASWLLFWPVTALAQVAPTSTPDADGNIYYMVQPNDSLWSIAARSGIKLQELLDLNEIEENSVVNPGDILLIAHVDPPATPTVDIPTPTLAPPTPTKTALPVRTAICMTAFEDANRDGKLNSNETQLAGVAFTVFNDQIVVANYITDGLSEPYCLEALAAGTYHVTRSIAPNEILTTQGDWAMIVTHGSELNLAFGSYQDDGGNDRDVIDSNAQFETRIAGSPAATPTAVAANDDALFAGDALIMVLLGIGVIALLLAGAVLIFWIAYSRKRENPNADEEN